MPTVRASSLPLRLKCGQAYLGDVLVQTESPAAALGNAVHAALERYIRDGMVEVEDVAKEFGVEPREMGPLVAAGIRAWNELRPFDGIIPMVEVPLSFRYEGHEVEITGTPDVWWHDGSHVRVLDWKTGRKDSDYSAQLKTYLAVLITTSDVAADGEATVVWLRTNEVEHYRLTRAQAQAWLESLEHELTRERPNYVLGDHCGFCPRAMSCPAKRQAEQRALATISPAGGGLAQIRTMEPAQVLDLYHQIKSLRQMLKLAEDEIRSRVSTAGPIEADGVELKFDERDSREVDAMKAWPALQKHLTDEQLASCVKVQLSKAQDMVSADAPRGEKHVRRRELLADLEAAGAVSYRRDRYLTEARKK